MSPEAEKPRDFLLLPAQSTSTNEFQPENRSWMIWAKRRIIFSSVSPPGSGEACRREAIRHERDGVLWRPSRS
jgi:hypothetical protein